MELENIILSDVSQVQKAKAACFLSYVEYNPNTSINNMKPGHTKGRLHMKEGR
jgi:hypothetical protein